MSAVFDPTVQRQYLEINNKNNNLELSGDFTIEFFLKTHANNNNYPLIMVANELWTTNTNLSIFTCRVDGPNVMTIFLGGTGSIQGTKYVNNGLWHHVVLVRNGTGTNNTKLYIDGISDGQTTYNYTINYNNPNGLFIGKNNINIDDNITMFKGSLSNLRIVKGTAVYTGNFTVPTTTLTNIPGTALLLFVDPANLFADGSSNNFTVTKFGGPTSSTDTPVSYAVCFKEDSKIMCFHNGEEKEMFVQDMRPGVLVKTLLDGYLPVHMIGTSKLWNPDNANRFTDRLYLLSQDKYPELNEDLVLTGAHSILVDELSVLEREKTFEKFNDIYVTDNKYRLIAEFDERAVPYEVEGEFNIYHFALKHDSEFCNYGVYANGLLVETCSKRYLHEYSNMTFL
jgi:hypothetical protein